jgi:hypothetical protein
MTMRRPEVFGAPPDPVPGGRERDSRRGSYRLSLLAVPTLALLLSLTPGSVKAQIPAPRETDITQRSGLIRRFVPIRSTLPGDCKRDDWYDTRWGDPPNRRKFQNFYPNGGIYGLPWRANDTMSIYPYFYGAPGESTLTEKSRPWPKWARLPQNILHPFKPVCVYYDQGSYVPVYDLDPLVPGPGPGYWPWYPPITHDGG